MNKDEWENSESAAEMLEALYRTQPNYFADQSVALHRFLIACCWKHAHLIPQVDLRAGLRGAEQWIDGKISDEELNRLNYYAEAEAFRIDYAQSEDEIRWLEALIKNIDQLEVLSFSEARSLLMKAAYFAEGSMVYPFFKRRPWIESLFTSQFLCAELLREYLAPELCKSI